jgi:MATE family multidrug resistance protein
MFSKVFVKNNKNIEVDSEVEARVNCSVASVVSVAFPIVLSLLSSNLMHLFARSLLAHFSITEMNGAAIAQQASNIILLPLLCFATISEVFVGQFNGAKAFRKASIPILQIIVFLLACCCFVCPLSVFFCRFLIPENLYHVGYPYFIVCMLIAPFQVIQSSVASFFVGTRRPSVIFYSVLFANIINIALAYFLIFGVDGVLKPLGAKGAAYATLISTIISSGVLLGVFLSHSNAIIYETRSFHFDSAILKKTIALGLPFAISHALEMCIWASLAKVLASVSVIEVTIQNVCVTLLNFFIFFADGVQKGGVALSSNCIGANQKDLISNLISSLVKVSLLVCLLIAIPLLFFPEISLKFVFNIFDLQLIAKAKPVLAVLWGCLSLIMISSTCFGGILNSGGDARFIILIRISVMVLCVAVPASILHHLGHFSAFKSWSLGIVQQLINGICFYLRYKSGSWNHNLIKFAKD